MTQAAKCRLFYIYFAAGELIGMNLAD